jgi:RHS repeat-associated protein
VSRFLGYDLRGNQILSYFYWDDPAEAAGGNGVIGNGDFDKTILTRTYYDDENRVIGTAQFTLDGESVDISSATPDWTTETTYNTAGQVVAQTDRFGATTYTLYDTRGNVVETRSPVRDAAGQARWLVTRTFYDENGRVTATSDPFIVENPLAPTDEDFSIENDVIDAPVDDRRVTQTIYDPAGRAVETRRLAGQTIDLLVADGEFTVPIYTTEFTAPTDPQVLASSILSRNRTVFDGAGRVAQAISYDTTHATDPFSAVLDTTWFEYDAAGRQTALIQAVDLDQDGTIETTDADQNGVPDGGPELVRTTTIYDAVGQQDFAIDARGVVTQFVYDRVGRVTKTIADAAGLKVETTTEYDTLGRRRAEIDPLENRTEFAYDSLGRLEQITLPAITDGTRGSVLGNAIYQYDYDQYGNHVSIVDPRTNETLFTYDWHGRQTSRTLPDDLTETMHYSDAPLEELTTLALSAGLGQLEYSVDFQGRVTAYRYDNSPEGGGRLAARFFYASEQGYLDDRTDGELADAVQTVEYAYDAFGRAVEIADSEFAAAAQPLTKQKYDADGRLIQIDSPQGVINYGFDRLGRLTRTWTSHGPEGSQLADAITDTRYGYDVLGRLASVTVVERNDAGPLDPQDQEVTAYCYDANGNLDLEIRSGGELTDELVTDYQYDALNRLDLLRHFADDGDALYEAGIDDLLAEYDYFLRADGKRERVQEIDDAGNETAIDWVYDQIGRLVEERYDAEGTQYDYIARYGFDLASNRLRLERDLAYAGVAFSADEVTTYDYDENDRLEREVFDDLSGANADKTTFYEYTGTEQTQKTVYDGILAEDPETGATETTSFAYNVQGHLSQVTANDGSSVTVSEYQYNDSGIRVAQTVTVDSGPASTTIFHVDPSNHTGYAQVLEQGADADADGRLDAVEIAKTITLGHDVIAQATSASAVLYLLYDGHGSTRSVVDAALALAQKYAYDAYGNMLPGLGLHAEPATALTSLLYSGEQTDATGLQYLRARYYDPTTGRFNRLDPFAGRIQDPLSLHKYLYTHGDPVMGTDPSGLTTLAEIKVSASTLMSSVSARFSAAIATGGAAVGRFFNSLGQQVQQLAEQTFRLFPRLEWGARHPVGQRVIDYLVRIGDRAAMIEVKYGLPRAAGDALNRLAAQMNAMVSSGAGQPVVWTLRAPTQAQLELVKQTAGPDTFNRVQFVEGIEGLYRFITLYFGL